MEVVLADGQVRMDELDVLVPNGLDGGEEEDRLEAD